VSSRDQDQGVVEVEFTVKDTGIGIPEAEQEKLFEVFTQLNMDSTREFGGVGLGLAICRRIADLMDAALTVESEEGVGSQFNFKVPLNYHAAGQPQVSERDSGKATVVEAREDDPGDPMKVLVVEDNPTNGFFMEKLLGGLGVQSELVTTGESALHRLAEQSFAVVFLDLHMPGIGGMETLKRLRVSEKIEGASTLPVYILTADASAASREQCEKLGCDGLLTKPVRVDAIKVILEECAGSAPGGAG
jgi:CheY-like chemotaxis protein